MVVQDPDYMDLCAIVWTVTAYVAANLKDKLPIDGNIAGGAHRPVVQPWVMLGLVCILLMTLTRRH